MPIIWLLQEATFYVHFCCKAPLELFPINKVFGSQPGHVVFVSFLLLVFNMFFNQKKVRKHDTTPPQKVAKERKYPYWLVKYSNLARYRYLGNLYPYKLELIQFDEHMLNQWVEATKWIGEILLHSVMIDGIQLVNPIDESWKIHPQTAGKKHRKNPTSRRIRRIRQVAELLEAVQLDAFGRRDRGSLDAKRHPQVQQTLMDRLAKALGVEARFHEKLEREGGKYEKNT